MVWTMLYASLSILIDGLVWGITGTVFCRAMLGADERWQLRALGTGTVFFFWEEIALNALARATQIGIQMGQKEISLSVDFFDVLSGFGSVFLGYAVGRKLLHLALEKRSDVPLPQTS